MVKFKECDMSTHTNMQEQREIKINLFGVKVLPREETIYSRKKTFCKDASCKLTSWQVWCLGVCNSPLVKVSS